MICQAMARAPARCVPLVPVAAVAENLVAIPQAGESRRWQKATNCPAQRMETGLAGTAFIRAAV